MSAIIQLQQECVRFLRRTYTPFRCRAPCRGRCVLRTRWGAALPKPLAHPQERNTRFASVPFLRVRYRHCQIGAHVKNANLTFLGFYQGERVKWQYPKSLT